MHRFLTALEPLLWLAVLALVALLLDFALKPQPRAKCDQTQPVRVERPALLT